MEVAAPLEPMAVEEPTAVVPAEEDSAGVDSAEEDSATLELSLAVAVAVAVGVALVSAGVELEELAPVVLALEAPVVTTGGTEMGWPAEEHCSTTALETAGSN